MKLAGQLAARDCSRCSTTFLSADGRRTMCDSCRPSAEQLEKRRGITRAFRARHPDRTKESTRRWAEANREYNRERNKTPVQIAKSRERDKRNYWANRDRELAAAKRHRQEHPEIHRAKARRYHARKLAAFVSPYSDLEIAQRDDWHCGICGSAVDAAIRHPDPRSASIDHVIPLIRGGTDEAANVRLAHLGCNSARGARMDYVGVA